MKMDLDHLKKMAGECRTQANTANDAAVRDEFLSLADYYDLLARELSASNDKSIPGRQAIR
jgi:hypothetical protein